MRRRLVLDEVVSERGRGGDPIGKLDESIARDAVGLDVFVFIDEILKHLIGWTRDEISKQVFVNKGEISRQVRGEARDEIGRAPWPP